MSTIDGIFLRPLSTSNLQNFGADPSLEGLSVQKDFQITMESSKANAKNQAPKLGNVTMETVMRSPPRVRSVSKSSSSSPASDTSPISHGKTKKKSTSLPAETVEYLKAWMMSPQHIAHPYPTEQEKREIMEATGIELKQLTNWFVNNRKRYWKPRVEARLREQQHEIMNPPTPPPVIKRSGSIVSLPEKAASPVTVQTTEAVVTPTSTGRPKRGAAARRPSVELVPQGSPFLTTTCELKPSVVSASNSVSVVSSDDEDAAREERPVQQEKSEAVDIHILRSAERSVPELSDVTILQNVPAERILRTFEKCALLYSFTLGNEKSRRDAEVVRVKKHYLSVYLAEQQQQVCATPSKKRKQTATVTPRPKFRRVSVQLWKEACQSAGHGYDDELPSLEEATQLFGYAM